VDARNRAAAIGRGTVTPGNGSDDTVAPFPVAFVGPAL